jgi:hypothetical protein
VVQSHVFRGPMKTLTFLRSLGASQPSVAHPQPDPARTRANTDVSLDGRDRVVIVGCGFGGLTGAVPASPGKGLYTYGS